MSADYGQDMTLLSTSSLDSTGSEWLVYLLADKNQLIKLTLTIDLQSFQVTDIV